MATDAKVLRDSMDSKESSNIMVLNTLMLSVWAISSSTGEKQNGQRNRLFRQTQMDPGIPVTLYPLAQAMDIQDTAHFLIMVGILGGLHLRLICRFIYHRKALVPIVIRIEINIMGRFNHHLQT